MAQQLVHGVVGVLAPGVVPLFLTDQLAAYSKALLTHFGCWVERISEKSGRILHRWMPRTPAMAGGITDHVWTMEEFLLFRAPPWRQGATVT